MIPSFADIYESEQPPEKKGTKIKWYKHITIIVFHAIHAASIALGVLIANRQNTINSFHQLGIFLHPTHETTNTSSCNAGSCMVHNQYLIRNSYSSTCDYKECVEVPSIVG